LGWDAFVAFFAFGRMPTQLSTVSTTSLILPFYLARGNAEAMLEMKQMGLKNNLS
jgi:hypothetical protein